MKNKRNFLKELQEETIICAEGYLFELERRGYLQVGTFVPEVVLTNPEVVEQLHIDFVRAGSDIIEALTYYAHDEKVKFLVKNDESVIDVVKKINYQALETANKAANFFEETTGKRPFVAGNICNTNLFVDGNEKTNQKIEEIFDRLLSYASDFDVDLIIGETFNSYKEAEIALKCIQKINKISVINFSSLTDETIDGINIVEACKRIHDLGADVVGLNCAIGPFEMLRKLQDIRKALPHANLAALPVPYNLKNKNFFQVPYQSCVCESLSKKNAFPIELETMVHSRGELAEFARQAKALKIHFLGICCGATPAQIRSITEASGKLAINSKFSPDLSKHVIFGEDDRLLKDYTKKLKEINSIN